MFIRKIDESCALVKGMATRLGADIEDAVGRDPVSQAIAYRAAVLKCTGCAQQDDCRRLQDENSTLETAPAYCRNTWAL